MEPIMNSLLTALGLFWKAFWALSLGYAFSSLIQVFISRQSAAKHLGKGSPKQLSLAAFLGFISSSCSFAALSATRSLFVKGASLVSSLAFMFASTNLAVEVAFLAYIFLGWQYALALFVGAPILISIQAILVKLTLNEKIISEGLANAKKLKDNDQTGNDDEKDLMKKISEKHTWTKVGSTYKAEWKMVYKEIAIGFLVAGFVSSLVPSSFFQAIFPVGFSEWILLPLQAILAPFISIITVIGSMGNGPLAAVLANNGILFGAIMVFLYSDFNVPPAVKINAKYYGWKFSSIIAAITALSAVLSGIIVHIIFYWLGILPTGAKSIEELSTFKIDYTFWLNILAVLTMFILFYLSRKGKGGHHHH